MCHHLSQYDAKRRENDMKRHKIVAKRNRNAAKRRKNGAKTARKWHENNANKHSAPPHPPKIGGLDPSLILPIPHRQTPKRPCLCNTLY